MFAAVARASAASIVAQTFGARAELGAEAARVGEAAALGPVG